MPKVFTVGVEFDDEFTRASFESALAQFFEAKHLRGRWEVRGEAVTPEGEDSDEPEFQTIPDLVQAFKLTAMDVCGALQKLGIPHNAGIFAQLMRFADVEASSFLGAGIQTKIENAEVLKDALKKVEEELESLKGSISNLNEVRDEVSSQCEEAEKALSEYSAKLDVVANGGKVYRRRTR